MSNGNPFDDPDAMYKVLVNEEGQHSLWPDFVEVPAGWQIVHGSAGRQSCVDYIESHWTDMRPKSLIADMKADKEARREPLSVAAKSV